MLPSKMSKSQKKNQLSSQNIFNKIALFPKSTDLKKNHIFSDSDSSFRQFDYLFTCLGLIAKLQINYFQHHVEFTRNDKKTSTLNFETRWLNIDPQSKNVFATRC